MLLRTRFDASILVNMVCTRHVLLNIAPNDIVKPIDNVQTRALQYMKQIMDLNQVKPIILHKRNSSLILNFAFPTKSNQYPLREHLYMKVYNRL